MVGVFVAFIRVVYGRTIYMSLPVSRDKISGLSVCLQWIDIEKVKIY